MKQTKRMRISEVFGPTIQGEGLLMGKPTVFVRTAGCDYRCSWCDTLYAVDSAYRNEWIDMTSEEVWEKVQALSKKPLTVSLSGGNPAIQPLEGLIERGKVDGYRFALETQGSIAKEWFQELDYLTLSPKPPSSHMKTDWDSLSKCIELAGDESYVVFKFVVFDEDDYTYAKKVSNRYPDLPVYLQPGNHTPLKQAQGENPVDMAGIIQRMNWLIKKVHDDCWYSTTILPQLHVMLWGNLRGV